MTGNEPNGEYGDWEKWIAKKFEEENPSIRIEVEIWPPASGEYDKRFNLAITSNTLPVGILSLQDDVMKRYREMPACASMSAIPILIIFSLFQRAFTRGVTVGALKG